MSLTTQQLIDAMGTYLDDAVGTTGFYTPTKALIWLNAIYRHLRYKILEEDPQGQHLATEADATYPANTRWQAFSGAGLGHWTTAGRPLKIFDVRVISAINANEVGIQIPVKDTREEEAFVDSYYGRYLLLDGDNIGYRDSGVAPSSTAVLRIRFSPPATAMTSGALAVVPPFIPDFYELIALKAAVHAASSEDKPIGDLATLSDDMERSLVAYLAQGRSSNTRPEVRVSEDTVSMYDYGR